MQDKRKDNMAWEKRLNITDSINYPTGKKYALTLRKDLNEWIDANSTGSKNSVVNFLVNVGINQVEQILKHDSIYEQVGEK